MSASPAEIAKKPQKHHQFNKYSRIEVRPIPGPVGAEVFCGDVRKLDAEAIVEIQQAWLDHLALVFHGQKLNDDELTEFARIFGAPEKAPPPADVMKARGRDNEYIAVISNVVENGVAIGSLGNDEAVWHTDMSYNSTPPAASLLHALEVSAAGGETGISNMYQALAELPEDLVKQVAGLTIYNDGSYNSAGQKRPNTESASHPIIRTHPDTGLNALYLGRRPRARINELSPEESEKLLNRLWTHATQEKFSWHHSWKVGDILIWDNRCTMHHRNAFDSSERRIMHRAQTKGSPLIKATGVGEIHPRYAMA